MGRCGGVVFSSAGFDPGAALLADAGWRGAAAADFCCVSAVAVVGWVDCEVWGEDAAGGGAGNCGGGVCAVGAGYRGWVVLGDGVSGGGGAGSGDGDDGGSADDCGYGGGGCESCGDRFGCEQCGVAGGGVAGDCGDGVCVCGGIWAADEPGAGRAAASARRSDGRSMLSGRSWRMRRRMIRGFGR